VSADLERQPAVAAAAEQAVELEVAARGPRRDDDAGLARKREVVARALRVNQSLLADPVGALAAVGGFEIAALTGAYLAAAQNGIPVLVDGYISTVAALVAVRFNPSVGDWLLYAHASAEPGHSRVLAALDARPLLNLGMRLGEGSGAATALPLLRLACVLHNGMATFVEAAVSEKI